MQYMAIIIKQDAAIYSLYLSASAVHVTGGIFTHHQQLISLYLQYMALLRPLLLHFVNVTGWERTVSLTL